MTMPATEPQQQQQLSLPTSSCLEWLVIFPIPPHSQIMAIFAERTLMKGCIFWNNFFCQNQTSPNIILLLKTIIIHYSFMGISLLLLLDGKIRNNIKHTYIATAQFSIKFIEKIQNMKAPFSTSLEHFLSFFLPYHFSFLSSFFFSNSR